VLYIFVEKHTNNDRRQSKSAKHFAAFASLCQQYRPESHQYKVQEDKKK
jgi:hypothetical protein